VENYSGKPGIYEVKMEESPVLGIIGGSGLYQFPSLKQEKTIEIETPFGKPSSPIMLGILAGKKVAFLARHGIGHFLSPTEVNYRANIYALKSLGIQQVVSISACGSLRDDYAPGQIVIPDQLVDFTRNRPRTFFGDGLVVHVGVAEPFCKELSHLAFDAVVSSGGTAHFGGSLITIEGPRFSTKGESNLFRAWGLSIIGMTACPEAFLAREAEMCYVTMAHVTDYDVWHMAEESVSVDMVIKTLNKNTQLAQKSILALLESLPKKITCDCEHALANAIITRPSSIPPATLARVSLLVKKYLSS
jgi:5'-methylthioadenosine phosphorylase